MSLFQFEREGDVDALLGVLEGSDNPEVRRRAAELLGQLDEEGDRREIVDALVAAADADDDGVVAAAVDALDQLGLDAVETLIQQRTDFELGDDAADGARAKAFTETLTADVPELRMAAANALGDVGTAESLPDLIERFDDRDPRVRARAARACGLIGDARAVDPLAGLLGDPTVAVRLEAAESLGRIGNRQALQALLSLYDDDSERVRRIAVAGFGKFDTDKPVDALVTALGDESPAVRRAAVYSLIELLATVPTDRSHEIREAVVERLSATDDGTVVEPLVELLTESTEPARRRNTAWLLGRVTDDERNRPVIDALVDALGDEDDMVRQFAATSLAQVGGGYAETRLLDLAEDDGADGAARAQAVFALGKVGGEDARRRLDALLDETEDEEIRQKTVAALSKLGGHDA